MGSEEQSLLDEVSARQSDGLLDQDNVPNENQSLTCFSCDEPMTGLFCYACGNKNDNYRRSVWSLGIELFQSLTAFEGRIWRSLLSLIIKPGQMSRDFSDGARQRWTSPIRMFLATSLLLFGYIAISGTQLIALGAVEKNSKDRQPAITFGDNGGDRYDQTLLFFVRKDNLVPLNRLEAFGQANSFLRGMADGLTDQQNPESIKRAIEELTLQIEKAAEGIGKEALIKTREGLELSLQQIEAANDSDSGDIDESEVLNKNSNAIDDKENEGSLQITNVTGERISLNREGVADIYSQVLRNPQIINNQLNTKLKWAMFFMMPFAMFMGAIFIRGREKAMLFDHLVHAAYIHAFSFLLLFVFILLKQYSGLPVLLLFYTLILMIYLPVSAKRMFGRGWFKSILTAYGVGSVYTILMTVVGIGIVGGALYDVASEVSDTQRELNQTQDTPLETTDESGT